MKSRYVKNGLTFNANSEEHFHEVDQGSRVLQMDSSPSRNLVNNSIERRFFRLATKVFYRSHLEHLDRRVKANCVDPHQTPLFAASDQGLHCLPLIQQK